LTISENDNILLYGMMTLFGRKMAMTILGYGPKNASFGHKVEPSIGHKTKVMSFGPNGEIA
jgi:hypothetical protein